MQNAKRFPRYHFVPTSRTIEESEFVDSSTLIGQKSDHFCPSVLRSRRQGVTSVKLGANL